MNIHSLIIFSAVCKKYYLAHAVRQLSGRSPYMDNIGVAEVVIWLFVLLIVIAKFVLIIYMVMRNKRKQEEGRQAVRRYVESLSEQKQTAAMTGPATPPAAPATE